MTQSTDVGRAWRDEQRARDYRFIAVLERLVPKTEEGGEQRGDRAALAELRRALGKRPGADVSAYLTVYRALGNVELAPWDEEPYFIVAPLFALYPEGTWRRAEGAPREAHDLGASFARLSERTESGSIERRFQALLDSDRQDLPVHLRYAVSLLQAHDVLIGWAELLGDIREWDSVDRRVQRKWARSYWGQMARREQQDESDRTAADESGENGENQS